MNCNKIEEMNIVKWLDKNLELMILAFLLAVMSVLSFTNVIMRYCFHSALSWSDEICCYCLALSAFFSLPCGFPWPGSTASWARPCCWESCGTYRCRYWD